MVVARCPDQEVARHTLSVMEWNFAKALGYYFRHHPRQPKTRTPSPVLIADPFFATSGGATHADESEDSDDEDAAAIRARLLTFVDSDDEQESGVSLSPKTAVPSRLQLTAKELAQSSSTIVVGHTVEEDEVTTMGRGARYRGTAVRVDNVRTRVQRQMQHDNDDLFEL